MEGDARRILALLHPALAAESLDTVGQEAVRAIGEGTQAYCVGLFLVLQGNLFKESWHGGESLPSPELRDRVRRLALEAADQANPGQPAPTPSLFPLVPYVHVSVLKERVTAVLFAFLDQCAPERQVTCELICYLGDLVAQRFNAILEIEAERRRSGQYERWFRLGDKQIRALDLERQKFAALVNALQAVVFVTDDARNVRWTSRPLLEQCPAGSRTYWTGHPCTVLCQRLGSACHEAGGSCIAARVHRSKRIERASMSWAETDAPAQMTALPLADLEGGTQEVMVILEKKPTEEREAA